MSLPNAYLDAGVLVAYGFGVHDTHYIKASEVIQNIIQGRYRGIVSILSLLETMDVIRKRVVDRTSVNILGQKSDLERKKYVLQESTKKYSKLIDDLTKAAKSNQIAIVDFKGTDISEVFLSCNDLLSKKFGDVLFFDRCWICRRRYEHYEYKGLGPVDAMHFDLAKRIPCDIFVTTDKGFQGLNGEINVNVI